MKPTLLVVAALTVLGSCSSSSTNAADGDSPDTIANVGDDGGDAAAGDGPVSDGPASDGYVPARCCVAWTAAAHPEIPSQCAAMAPEAGADDGNTSEPCWSDNAAGYYGRWTCGGADGGDNLCADNGESCNVGDTCYLQDIGCPGTVQDCYYPWAAYPRG